MSYMASSSYTPRDREPDASADESPDSVRSDKSSRYSISGVAAQWDDEPEVRLRMRNNDHLLKHWDSKKGAETNDDVSRNVANLKLNYKVLSPLLKKMTQNGHFLPVIDNIMEEVRNLLTRCKVQHDGERVYREGWAIKKLLSLAKSQMWKDRNPKENGLQTCCMSQLSSCMENYMFKQFKSKPGVLYALSVLISLPVCSRSQHTPALAQQDPICRSILMDLGITIEEAFRPQGWEGEVPTVRGSSIPLKPACQPMLFFFINFI